MRTATWVLAILATLLSLTGCGGVWGYQGATIDEQVKLIQAAGGSGCFYLRGNARPYADVSLLAVSTYGKDAPKYLDCLKAIPPEARGMLQMP